MKARIKWIEGAAFLGESGSGHGFVLSDAETRLYARAAIYSAPFDPTPLILEMAR